MRVNGWDGDPTGPPPPLVAADGPAPAYAVIHTSHHISHISRPPPCPYKSPPPGGIYNFQNVRTNVRFAFKLSKTVATVAGVARVSDVSDVSAFKHMQEKHKLVLDFIKAYIKLHGVAPSYSVIARGLGMKSKSNIHRIIHKLKEGGMVAVKPYQFNSIRVIDRSVREVASL